MNVIVILMMNVQMTLYVDTTNGQLCLVLIVEDKIFVLKVILVTLTKETVTVMINARMVFFVVQITVTILFILPLKLITGNINFCTTLMWKIETMLILVNSVNSLLRKPGGSNWETAENVYVMSWELSWSPNNNNTEFCCKMSQFGNSDGSTIAIPR